jgi:hypothetical protein
MVLGHHRGAFSGYKANLSTLKPRFRYSGGSALHYLPPSPTSEYGAQ